VQVEGEDGEGTPTPIVPAGPSAPRGREGGESYLSSHFHREKKGKLYPTYFVKLYVPERKKEPPCQLAFHLEKGERGRNNDQFFSRTAITTKKKGAAVSRPSLASRIHLLVNRGERGEVASWGQLELHLGARGEKGKKKGTAWTP